MKSKKTASLLALIIAMMRNAKDTAGENPKKAKGAERDLEIATHRGLKAFEIEGKTFYALNEKNARRKFLQSK